MSMSNPQKPIKQLSANDPAIEKWMWDAAYDIDGLIGLTRFDLAITWQPASSRSITRSPVRRRTKLRSLRTVEPYTHAPAMRLRILSDLHLEFDPGWTLRHCGEDAVLCAGDLGS